MEQGSGKHVASLLVLLLVEGGVVLAHQIVAPKILAPLFGNSILVWSSVLVCTLAGLACGYLLGDIIAKRGRICTWLATSLVASALVLWTVPALGPLSVALLDSLPLRLGVIVGAGCTVAPLMALLGTCCPLAVALLCHRGWSPAHATGFAFGASTVGGIIAAPLVGLWSMPILGIRLTCLAEAMLLLVAAAILSTMSRGARSH